METTEATAEIPAEQNQEATAEQAAPQVKTVLSVALAFAQAFAKNAFGEKKVVKTGTRGRPVETTSAEWAADYRKATPGALRVAMASEGWAGVEQVFDFFANRRKSAPALKEYFGQTDEKGIPSEHDVRAMGAHPSNGEPWQTEIHSVLTVGRGKNETLGAAMRRYGALADLLAASAAFLSGRTISTKVGRRAVCRNGRDEVKAGAYDFPLEFVGLPSRNNGEIVISSSDKVYKGLIGEVTAHAPQDLESTRATLYALVDQLLLAGTQALPPAPTRPVRHRKAQDGAEQAAEPKKRGRPRKVAEAGATAPAEATTEATLEPVAQEPVPTEPQVVAGEPATVAAE